MGKVRSGIYDMEPAFSAGFKAGKVEAMKRIQALFWDEGLPVPYILSAQEAFEAWKRALRDEPEGRANG